MTQPSLLAAIAPHMPAALEPRYRQALARGGNDTRSTEEEERTYRPLGFMTLAGNRIPDVARLAGAIQQRLMLHQLGLDPVVVELIAALRVRSAGAVRLVHRALEIHARDVGYSSERWVERALEHAAFILDEAHRPPAADTPTPFGLTRRAARFLGDAITATEADRLGVADGLASAQACFLLLYLWSSALLDA